MLSEFNWMEETRNSYDASAVIHASRYSSSPHVECYNKFLSQLTEQADLLDLGCGHGNWAKLFSERGFNVTGIDFSKNLIRIAKKVAPQAKFLVINMLDLNFPHESFDGVWANASLLHIPKKWTSQLLKNIHCFLKNNGWLQLCVKEGEGEVFEQDMRYGGLKKFWAYYQTSEIVSLLEEAGFRIEETIHIPKPICLSHPTHAFIKVLAQKKITLCH